MRLPLPATWICLLALALVGCDRSTATVPPPAEDNFGQFEGEVVAAWDADGRNMTLREDFVYVDPQENRWVAPAGAVVNGASIPRLFWTVIGGPFEGKYRNASVVHDVGCVQMQQSWEAVHRMFYEACRCGGVDEAQAKIMYYAVYHFGPRWQVIEDIAETLGAGEQSPDPQPAVSLLARMDPLPPTPDELEQVVAYIAEDNPDPAAIERLDRQSLHRRPTRGRREPAPGRRPGGMPTARPDRTPTGKPERTPAARPDGIPATRPGEGGPRQPRFDHAPAASERPADPRNTTPPSRRPPGNGAPLSEEQQAWATQIVREHLQQQTGSPRPAEYQVQRSRGGYLVSVQFLHEDQDGQLVPYPGGTCTVRLSPQGQVLSLISGANQPSGD